MLGESANSLTLSEPMLTTARFSIAEAFDRGILWFRKEVASDSSIAAQLNGLPSCGIIVDTMCGMRLSIARQRRVFGIGSRWRESVCVCNHTEAAARYGLPRHDRGVRVV